MDQSSSKYSKKCWTKTFPKSIHKEAYQKSGTPLTKTQTLWKQSSKVKISSPRTL